MAGTHVDRYFSVSLYLHVAVHGYKVWFPCRWHSIGTLGIISISMTSPSGVSLPVPKWYGDEILSKPNPDNTEIWIYIETQKYRKYDANGNPFHHET